ncbi:MAG: phosphoribosyltransferase [Planctomycetes bacterium]|nr:phosphoribosyltransferase [Planctomycetota bacterium]
MHADESVLKKHPAYPAAKKGDSEAAERLVLAVATIGALDRISALLGSTKPTLVAVHALETEGMNAIPRVFARILAQTLDLPTDRQVVQINRVVHTGADGYSRLAFPALFDGEARPGQYFLVDDFVAQGGTLANLKGFLEQRGGAVVGATALGGKAYSARLRLDDQTLKELRGKHGPELETWWHAAFGYGFDRLTESEARYLIRADDAHAISTRIVAASRSRNR